jgi:BirA family transcriptional regulator, biotin operon repressor / biotin---[acetyl-CoA-carboxylase] ligase
VDERTPLDPATLRLLAGDAWPDIEIVEETGSTNADLLARANRGENITATALLAEYQRSGRGRHGRNWSTPPRSQVAMSVGVDAAGIDPDAWGWLPLLTGVSVVEAIEQVCGVRAGLKWPNDVLAGDGKLAGILAEVASPAPVIVIGLGLNVSLTAADAPTDQATSLTMLGKPDVDRNVLAARILHQLADRIEQWRSTGGAAEQLVAAYRRHSVTLGARVRAMLPGDHDVVGVATDIDALGRLVIDDGSGLTTVAAGDITHLR